MKVYLPHPENKNELENITIHEYDIWNMDVTLAQIIYPMLMMLRYDTFGYPEELKTQEEWHDALDSMIYSFNQARLDYPAFLTCEGDEYTKEANKQRIGFALFGRYFTHLWT